MRQKSRILVIALAIIVASMALDAILVIAAAPTAASVGSATAEIQRFLDCVKGKITVGTPTISISDTVECLPGSCTVTLTMSDFSAQEACGSATTCQLPRVILKCPGPPQVEYTYLLCGTGSTGAGGVIGSNRIEIGVVVGSSTGTNPGSSTMLMADVPVPPGTNTVGTLTDAFSLFEENDGKGKGCNTCCHKDGGSFKLDDKKTLLLSERIEVFQEFANSCGDKPETVLAPFIIYTNDPIVGSNTCKVTLKEGLKYQTLSEICDCIEAKLNRESFRDFPGVDPNEPDPFITPGTGTTKEQAEVVLKLCRALQNKDKGKPNIAGTCTPSITPTPKPSPTDSPTVITLSFFNVDVVGDDGTVLINWETASEIDNAEFNLYRAKTKDGRYKKINDIPIPAQGSAVYEASYSFVDRPPATGTYYYKLEDVDYYGVSTLHGPVKVRVRSGGGEARRR